MRSNCWCNIRYSDSNFNSGIYTLGSKGYKVDTGNIVQEAISYIYAMFVVNIGWVFLRTLGLKHVCSYILSMFGLNDLSAVGHTAGWYLTKFNIVLFLAVCIISLIFF